MSKELITWKSIAPEGFTASINGKAYEFGIYTLGDAIWFEDKYGPVGITELIQKHPSRIIHEIAWRTLKNKTDFPTFESFTEALTIGEVQKIDFTAKVLKVLGVCLETQIEESDPASNGEEFHGAKNTPLGEPDKTEHLRGIYRRAVPKTKPATVSDKMLRAKRVSRGRKS